MTGTVLSDCLALLTTITLGLVSQTARAALITVRSPTGSAANARRLLAGTAAGTIVLWLETDLTTLAVFRGVLAPGTECRTVAGCWWISAV